MADNVIQIEVELKGQKEATKRLETLKDGAKEVGEGFQGITKVMDKSTADIGEGLATMTGAVGESIDAFSELKSSVANFGTGGASSLMGLIGPIGMVTAAVATLYEGFRQLSGAAEEAKNREEAMAAAASDLFSKLEALAEGGVVPATEALMKFTEVTLQSQMAKDLLEKQVEKTRPKMEALSEAVEDEAKARAELNKLDAKGRKLTDERSSAQMRLNTAEMRRIKAQGELRQKIKKLNEPMQQNLKLLAEASKQEKELEKNTTDNLKAKVKEQAERLKALQIAEQELYTKDELVLSTAKEQFELEASKLALKADKMTRDELTKTIKEQGQAILTLTQQEVEGRAQATKARRAFAEEEKKEAEAEAKRRAEAAKARQAIAEAEAKRQIILSGQLKQLEIKIEKDGDAELLALAKARRDTGLQLAKEDAMSKAIVQKQYELEVQSIQEQAANRALALQQKIDDQLAAGRKKQADERAKAFKQQLEEQKVLAAQVSDVLDMYGTGLAEAAVSSILFGEGFKKAAGEVLKALAVESGVRALMKTAEATAMLLINPALSANLFAAAGGYAAAAGVAYAGASALGAGGGGGTGGATASPSGAPQTATAPQRERAETSSSIVNINFGGAVIYDTKEAARRAMMNDLVRTYNSTNRGSVRFAFDRGTR